MSDEALDLAYLEEAVQSVIMSHASTAIDAGRISGVDVLTSVKPLADGTILVNAVVRVDS